MNPWQAPMMIASAQTIALRTMLMWPAGGRHDAWQRREAVRMVSEKADAVREAQLEALTLAWRMVWMPWTVWTPGGSALSAATHAAAPLVTPFSKRARGNARRLTSKALSAAGSGRLRGRR